MQIASMRWVSFFAKFVFICNTCFLVSVLLQAFKVVDLPQWLIGTLLILGWFPFGTLMNVFFLVLTGYLLLRGKRLVLPVIITWLNICIGISQFIYYLFV